MDYLVHNGVRDIETRTVRAVRATHRGLVQFIMGGTRRLIRGKPVQINERQLKAHMQEFLTKEAAGVLYLTTLDHRVVDIKTLKVANVPVVNPRPQPLDDSLSRDKASGIPMNSHVDLPPPAEFEMPVAPPVAAMEQPVSTTPATGLPPVESSTDYSRGGKRRGGR